MGRGSGNHNRVIGSLIMDLLMCCMMCRCCISVPFIYLYITMEMMEGKLKMVNSWTLGGCHIPRNSQELAMFSFPYISCCILYAVIYAQVLMYSKKLQHGSSLSSTFTENAPREHSADNKCKSHLSSYCLPVQQQYVNGWNYPPQPTLLPPQIQPDDHRCHGSGAGQQVRGNGNETMSVDAASRTFLPFNLAKYVHSLVAF